jgi:hypothetical protein
MDLRGTYIATMEDIKWNATAELREIPKEAFRRFFQYCRIDGASVCVYANVQGFYFESG